MEQKIKNFRYKLMVYPLPMISFFNFQFLKSIRKQSPILKMPEDKEATNILFLHHSTGNRIWDGGVEQWFENYNRKNQTKYAILEQEFPKNSPYGWNNYPYDYWNIWVKHSGGEPYKREPTLEMISDVFDIVVLKHCFPVGDIEANTGDPDVSSSKKRLENYKLQYTALKKKMMEFPKTKFIVWTGAALTQKSTISENAKRAHEFFLWVKNEWDEKDDNIFIWDFYALETEGTLYLQNKYAGSPNDSHPNSTFSKKVAPLFCQRIVDVIEGSGDSKNITGKLD